MHQYHFNTNTDTFRQKIADKVTKVVAMALARLTRLVQTPPVMLIIQSVINKYIMLSAINSSSDVAIDEKFLIVGLSFTSAIMALETKQQLWF